MNVYLTIKEKLKESKIHMTLIDPATTGTVGSARIAMDAERAGTDFILIGGSTKLTIKEMDEATKEIKDKVKVPVIIFPGSSSMLTDMADAIFFMSLLNSRDREFIIDHQVKASKVVKLSGIESIPMGYVIFEPGMTAGKIGKADLISRDNKDLAVQYGLAAELLGMKLLYFEAGSGAGKPVSLEVVEEVKKYISIPLIVGGGIRESTIAKELCSSGADIIVTGTIAEKAQDVYGSLEPIIKAIKSVTIL
jgi:phosphoglycerol geranylgeranyltransferase